MKKVCQQHAEYEQELREAITLHEIEDNPLTSEEIDMFTMFKREGWSEERCREYIFEQLAQNNKTNLDA